MIASAAYITRFETKNTRRTHLGEPPEDSSTRYTTINTYSEYAVICFVVYYLWVTVQRILPIFRLRFKSLAQAPEMFLFSFTCLLVLACIPLRILELHQYEDLLAALIMFTLPLKLLFFCRASKSVGSFVVMIYKILVNDVLCFVVFMVIFVAGFSQCKCCFQGKKPQRLIIVL